MNWSLRVVLAALFAWDRLGEGWMPMGGWWLVLAGFALVGASPGEAVIVQNGYDGAGPVEYEFGPFEFEVRTGGRHYRARWSQLTRIEETPDRYRLWIEGTYHVLPKRFFEPGVDARWRDMAATESGRAITAWTVA